MALFLIEASISNFSLEQTEGALEEVARAALNQRSELIEAQLAEALQWLFMNVDSPQVDIAQQLVEQADLQVSLVKAVHLVGQELDMVRSRKAKANYLVEWNLPAGLTLQAYLSEQAQKLPLLSQVSEVNFERTYLCKDGSKVLSLYDSPTEAAVKQARAITAAPVDLLAAIRSVF